MKKTLPFLHPWRYLFLLSVLCSYFYVAMEGLFLATMPSFLDAFDGAQKIGVLFISAGIVALFTTLLLLLCLFFDFLILLAAGKSLPVGFYAACLLPAGILAALCLLLLDNFTYTIFKLGIVSSRGIFRTLYILILIVLLYYFYKWALRFTGVLQKPYAPLRYLYVFSSVLILVTVGFVIQQNGLSSMQTGDTSTANRGSPPNILILGSDGINASNMSVYGYERKTTPYLEQLAGQSLVAENAFANAGNSTGSVASMLTGKLPTRTRVLYTPNILTGSDAYQHLPGILRAGGYFTVELGYTRYVDAYEVNLLDGFDQVNLRSLDEDPFFRSGQKFGYGDSFLFLSRVSERLLERLLHIFFIQTMENPFKLVTEQEHPFYLSDREKMDQLLDLIANARQPLFAHVHLMGTHGPKFSPVNRVFSAGVDQDANWMRDYYDDAILDFDGYVREVFNTLRKTGKLENTIVVIYTDHNMEYLTTQRIPLMFYFPKGEHAGRIHNNVQNLDIAPTLLDYLGIPVPEWMTGHSLLRGEPPSDRPIFSASVGEADPTSKEPPFYQFEVFDMIVCHQWFEFRVPQQVFLTGVVNGHSYPCDGETVVSSEIAAEILLGHLQEMDFHVQSIP